jgi:hypothetical protein
MLIGIEVGFAGFVCVCVWFTHRYCEMRILQSRRMELCKGNGGASRGLKSGVRCGVRLVVFLAKLYGSHMATVFAYLHASELKVGFFSCRVAGVTELFITFKSSTMLSGYVFSNNLTYSTKDILRVTQHKNSCRISSQSIVELHLNSLPRTDD